jgi:hypothetical protein
VPVNRKANQIGSFDAEETALFWRVFDALKVPGESEADAEHRGSRIIANYSAGVTDERELIEVSRQPLGR